MMWNFESHLERVAAIADRAEVITYGDLDLASSALARNIDRRCLVFSLCTNSIGSLVGYTGMITHRIVPLLLDAGLDLDLLKKLIDIYHPAYLWMPSTLASHFTELYQVYEDRDYVLLKTSFDCCYPLFDDLALLLTTSGSTGSPKLVRLSADNLKSNAQFIAEYLQLDQTDRPVTTLPMNYSYGLSIINSHLAVGATLLMTGSSIMERVFWTFFKEQNATSLGGVPYTFEILKRLRFFRMELPSLRTITQAGGKLTLDLSREFAEYAEQQGIRFFVMYGQTEATARMSYLAHEYALSKCGSIGKAIPGGEFFLIDDNGIVIDRNEQEGELVYRGPNVSLGYAECLEDLAKGDERAGVLFTGDMARRDEDGFYYITGRKKRFIKLFGNRLNLDEAEHLIKELVPECACCGFDDNLLAYITEQGREDDVRQFIALKTGIHFSAISVKYLPEIPKNQSGKTQYGELMCWMV